MNTTATNPRSNRLLSRRQLESKLSLSRAHIYAAVRVGELPKPIKIGISRVAWLESEIEAWIEERVSARNFNRKLKQS